MSNLEKSLICASMINTIFSEYKAGELKGSGELIRSRIAKFMRQRSKTNRKLVLDVIKKSDKAWRNTINHFAKQQVKIEAKTTIAEIYNYIPLEIEKFTNVKESDIEKFTMAVTDNFEAEQGSYKVVEYLMDQLGFEKKKSLFSGKKLTIKNNMILDGLEVKECF